MHQGVFSSTDGSSSFITHSSFLLWKTMDGRENNAQRTAAGRVLSVSMLPLDPSEWPIVCDSWSEDWREWDKWQPTPCQTAKQRKVQTKLWTQMLQICPNYYYAPSRGQKTPGLMLLTAWMPLWEMLLLNLAPSGWSQAEKALHCSAGWPGNALHSLCQNICAINFQCIT